MAQQCVTVIALEMINKVACHRITVCPVMIEPHCWILNSSSNLTITNTIAIVNCSVRESFIGNQFVIIHITFYYP